MRGLVLTTALLAAVPLALRAQTYAPPAAGDYGANGSNVVYVHTMTNPVYPTANGTALVVSVVHPDSSINTNLPTIFVAHGFTSPAGNAANYAALLTNLASRGYNVVFSPYEGGVPVLNNLKRFDELTTGFESVVTNYQLNTAKCGFIGHSWGGGFLPAVVRFAMMGNASAFRSGHTWGGTAAFFFSMAPAFPYDGGGQTAVTNSPCIVFPANLNVIVQVYNDDLTVVDPRVAIDMFYNFTTRNRMKEFLTVYGDSQGTPAQLASHFLPNTDVAMTSTSLQAWSIFRHLDALAAWTFAGDTNAQVLALGDGVAAETYNGVWSDSTPAVRIGVTDIPSPAAYADVAYQVRWSSGSNPRGKFGLFSGPPAINSAGVQAGSCWMSATNLLTNHAYAVQSTASVASDNWVTVSNFVPVATAPVLTNAITNATCQFWRLLAP